MEKILFTCHVLPMMMSLGEPIISTMLIFSLFTGLKISGNLPEKKLSEILPPETFGKL
jgi:hypothetical protein